MARVFCPKCGRQAFNSSTCDYCYNEQLTRRVKDIFNLEKQVDVARKSEGYAFKAVIPKWDAEDVVVYFRSHDDAMKFKEAKKRSMITIERI